ncbi:D-alanyl-D-alanine carboxypeptidase/D-alanyl-D-alanine endopeptidase [Kocuria tytonis]|uniref:D-alanyl-D-alanine carboxypeptidase/D-alanyl-D-alanine-endopeptidase n=1 Tax=Kocuria tytonis TaxID=2054280 RepID=A0A495A5U7_9MICC|nr:D-alanyl-D-alanine carboxypeptidase/D-alanyl-D-alanine-endopeptidase [Kocuria tytonis]RKQ33676.1 D-alanyl-D-alanine carboxypeptidase/D-alanyl-D-alanine-endopeptidase [Kocuria tytonis]
MPSTPPRSPGHAPLRPLLCVLLALAVAGPAVFALPALLAELRPAAQWRQAHAALQDSPPVASRAPAAASSPGADGSAGNGAETSGSGDRVTAEAVERALRTGLDGAPGTAAVAVSEAGEDALLAGREQTRPMVPASNQKLLTALSIAEAVDPYDRLATTVVGGPDLRSLTLVAGGDTLLAPGEGDPAAVNGRAGLGTLAERTARALRERSADAASGGLTVAVDTNLFTGPDRNPAWQREDVESGEITRVSPIALYSHRVPAADGADPGSAGDRPADPARAAAEEFARQLRDRLGHGVHVTVRGSAPAPADAAELARVESAPVHEQSAYMLAHSDNSLAEALARVAAARSGREPGVDGVRQMLPAALRAHGIDTAGLRVLDASGMAPDNRVTATALLRTVGTLLREPRFGPYGRGLPVAGGSGTLAERFDDAPEAAARGVSRAKTGTLLDVVALTGYVQRPDGRVLVYSVVLNGVAGRTADAKDSVDRTVAALATSS